MSICSWTRQWVSHIPRSMSWLVSINVVIIASAESASGLAVHITNSVSVKVWTTFGLVDEAAYNLWLQRQGLAERRLITRKVSVQLSP